MNNIIQTPIRGIDIENIDKLLPFENRGVWIWHVTFKKTGYGRWLLILDIDVADKKIILSTSTTNSELIDYWDRIDSNSTLDADYSGKIAAIAVVLAANEDTLTDFVSAMETKEANILNIE